MKVFKPPRFLSWIYPRRNWGFSHEKNTVYLTFDDGPTPELTTWILNTLQAEEVVATFFCVGENILKNKTEFTSIKLNGHQVGSHTMRHEKSNKTSWRTYLKSVEDCAALTENLIFRPPYGRLSALRSFLLSRKNFNIIMWSWLSYDYDHSVPIDVILESAQKEIKAGDVLVLHDNVKVEERIKILLPELIRIVRKKGLTFSLIQ